MRKKLKNRGTALVGYAILLSFVSVIGFSFVGDKGFAGNINSIINSTTKVLGQALGLQSFNEAALKDALVNWKDGNFYNQSDANTPLMYAKINKENNTVTYGVGYGNPLDVDDYDARINGDWTNGGGMVVIDQGIPSNMKFFNPWDNATKKNTKLLIVHSLHPRLQQSSQPLQRAESSNAKIRKAKKPQAVTLLIRSWLAAIFLHNEKHSAGDDAECFS